MNKICLFLKQLAVYSKMSQQQALMKSILEVISHLKVFS